MTGENGVGGRLRVVDLKVVDLCWRWEGDTGGIDGVV